MLFGYGMALANACGARSLVLLGSGNLRSLVTLLCLAVGASATLTGVLAPLRIRLTEATPTPLAATTLPDWLAGLVAMPDAAARWGCVALLVAGLLGWAFTRPDKAAAPDTTAAKALLILLLALAHAAAGRADRPAGAAGLVDHRPPGGRRFRACAPGIHHLCGPGGPGAAVPAAVHGRRAGPWRGAVRRRAGRRMGQRAAAPRFPVARVHQRGANGPLDGGRRAHGCGRRAGAGLLHRPGPDGFFDPGPEHLPRAGGHRGGHLAGGAHHHPSRTMT
ncbi:MAG: YeeE/YedE family protein [Acidovorax sp.]|nr:YeeE/YedE family protein [Acidovorax sp.]